MATRLKVGLGAVTLLVLLAPVVPAARADDQSLSAGEVAAALNSATPDTLNAAVSTTPDPEAPVALDAGGTTVPSDPSDGIVLSAGGTSIGVGLPSADQADNAQAVQDGVVSFDSNNGSSSVPVVESDGSVQINTVIADAAAPSTYAYPVSVPAGDHLTLDPDSGAVSIVDADGAWVGGVAPAWAKDASGAAVPTSYALSGNTLVQTVDLSSSSITYPVVADPWFGIDLIDHTRWANTWQYSPTLQITPTWWGRFGAGALADGAAWDEVLKKTARSGHPNPNTAAMRVQFDCHFLVVRLKSPNKATWDLDSKLPYTDFTNEVRYGCNYPAGSRQF